jgi:hypothetical protein
MKRSMRNLPALRGWPAVGPCALLLSTRNIPQQAPTVNRAAIVPEKFFYQAVATARV